MKYAEERGVDFPRSENYQARTGRGAEAEVGGHHYFVGNHRFAHELAVCSDAIENVLADIEEQGQSVVVVGHKPHADCAGFGSPPSCAVLTAARHPPLTGVFKTRTPTLPPSYGDGSGNWSGAVPNASALLAKVP